MGLGIGGLGFKLGFKVLCLGLGFNLILGFSLRTWFGFQFGFGFGFGLEILDFGFGFGFGFGFEFGFENLGLGFRVLVWCGSSLGLGLGPLGLGSSRLPRYYKRVVKKRLKLLKKKLDALSHRSFLVTFLFTRDYLKYLKLFIIDRFKSSNGNANTLTGYLKYQTIAAFLARISV